MKGHVLRRCPKPIVDTCETGRCAHRYAWTFSAGTDLETNKRRQFTGGGFKTKRDAEAACRKAIMEFEAGTLQSRGEKRLSVAAALAEAGRRPTVGAFMTAWLDGKTGLRPSTSDNYRSHIEGHIVPGIGDLLLEELTVGDVRAFLASLAVTSPATGRMRTRTTIARVRATLTSALNDAVLDELIPRNPAMRVPLPENAAPASNSELVWTSAQLGQFLSFVKDDRLVALFHVEAFSGFRRGELLGLRWCDVDLDASTLRVAHTITAGKGGLRSGEPKTKKSVRTVSIDARTAEALRKHRARQGEERLGLGSAWQNELDLVFVREDGSPLRPNFVTRRFQRLSKAASLPVIRLHDLRHTHASQALEAGVPVKVVADRLGHSSTAITENLYQHVVRQVAADAATLIAGLVTDASLGAALGAASNSASK